MNGCGHGTGMQDLTNIIDEFFYVEVDIGDYYVSRNFIVDEIKLEDNKVSFTLSEEETSNLLDYVKLRMEQSKNDAIFTKKDFSEVVKEEVKEVKEQVREMLKDETK